jgi:Txe/YoeB family toxin of Txe-Axe toxin-antitoxin module
VGSDRDTGSKIEENKIHAEIIHIDSFGNIITNIQRDSLKNSNIVEGLKRLGKYNKEYSARVREEYDVIIVGAGPAGLSTAIMCATRHLRILLLEKDKIGGLLSTLYPNKMIPNYPGFPGGFPWTDHGRPLFNSQQSHSRKGILPARPRGDPCSLCLLLSLSLL